MKSNITHIAHPKEHPAFIHTGQRGSFAHRTITERLPFIVDRVIASNAIERKTIKNLRSLKKEMGESVIINPFEGEGYYDIDKSLFENAEINTWNSEIAKYKGKSWLEIPWYFAEAYFYLRLLIAFGYYSRYSKNRLKDPFEVMKLGELETPQGGIDLAIEASEILEDSMTAKKNPSGSILEKLILLSLWGNRIDLSNYQIASRSKGETVKKNRELLIIDDTKRLSESLLKKDNIHMILDNAGQELVADLILCLYLLSTRSAKGSERRITLHVKRTPFFVSDTVKKDIFQAIERISMAAGREKYKSHEKLGEIAENLKALIERGRLKIAEHYFWNGPLHFIDFPGEIRLSLSQADIVILKGDANYRRLLSDRQWNPTLKLKELTEWFPADFAVLRTLKSELIVDVSSEKYQSYSRKNPEWLTDGRMGIVQLVNIR